MQTTLEAVRDRWCDPKLRPSFGKGELIGSDGCCCAQGEVLRSCGMTDDQIRAITQEFADKEVADKLGISLFHSVLLRKVNDSQEGCPERVLLFTDDGLGKVLGPNWRPVIAFGEHMSAMTEAQWAAAWAAARAAAWAAARDAARAAAWAAAASASSELQGWTKLTTEPYFLKFFGITDAKAFVEAAERRWR